MRLRKAIQEKIKRSVQVKNRLALAFAKSGYTIERWIDDNEENGDLTKAMAIQIIKDELHVDDSEVLEAESQVA